MTNVWPSLLILIREYCFSVCLQVRVLDKPYSALIEYIYDIDTYIQTAQAEKL
jgi:hypothetical protein